jgi:hypothetical protein
MEISPAIPFLAQDERGMHLPFTEGQTHEGSRVEDDLSLGSGNRSRSSTMSLESHSTTTVRSKTGFLEARRPFTPWACDFCKIATFPTYQEACAHERVCMMNGKTRKSSSVVLLLSQSKDKESLSDRQCYVRSNFVELFTASDKDALARHSRGAQKLNAGQVGIRCIYCVHLPQKERSERAICYPSSLSRIYQTVADMQRFHFEICQSIPEDIKHTYRSMKTTRPRGVGSPQAYWVESAKAVGLVDSEQGIRYNSTKFSTHEVGFTGCASTGRMEFGSPPSLLESPMYGSREPSPLNGSCYHLNEKQNMGQETSPSSLGSPVTMSRNDKDCPSTNEKSLIAYENALPQTKHRDSNEAAILLLLRGRKMAPSPSPQSPSTTSTEDGRLLPGQKRNFADAMNHE